MKQAILMISLVMIVAVLPIFSRQNIVREKSVTRDELLHFTAEWGKPEELGELPNNPVLPGFHADPEILYSNKTKKYYIYSTTDGQPGWGGWYFTVFFVRRLEELEG